MRKVKFTLSLLGLLIFLGCKTTQVPDEAFECNLIDKPIKTFKIDPFGNIFTIDKTNRLRVYDPELELLFEYYNNSLGEIGFLDISNPRKIIIFFRDFQKMIFLDNTLSEIERFERSVEMTYDIRAIGSSRDNNVWVYDALDYKLKKISPKGKVLLESNPIQSYLEITIIPDYIIEQNNEVYLIDEGTSIAKFDNFGNYLNYELIEGYSFKFSGNQMNFVQKAGLHTKYTDNPFIDPVLTMELPDGVRKAYQFKNTVYFLEDSCLKTKS